MKLTHSRTKSYWGWRRSNSRWWRDSFIYVLFSVALDRKSSIQIRFYGIIVAQAGPRFASNVQTTSKIKRPVGADKLKYWGTRRWIWLL